MDRQQTETSHMFHMQATSAESNALNIAASLWCECLILSKFVDGSPIAKFIQKELRACNISYEGSSGPRNGPWGNRQQFNIADSGFGVRAPIVNNNRAGEIGRSLNIKEFDLDRIFGKEGIEICHISGLIAALSTETSELCLELVKTAQNYNTKVSFDLNYRASQSSY